VNVKKLTILFLLSAITLLSVQPVSRVLAQSADNQPDEVLLHFRYQNLVDSYTSALYKDDTFFISVHEIFDLLKINLSVDRANKTLSGTHADGAGYQLFYDDHIFIKEGKEISIPKESILINSGGVYLEPKLFSKLFDLSLSVNFANLSLRLDSSIEMPVVSERNRELRRQKILSNEKQIFRSYYPLKFERKRRNLRAGFLDYNFTATRSDYGSTFNYATGFGAEVFGGDIQGNIFGSYSASATVFNTSNLRWRYGIRENQWLTSIIAGQSVSRGVTPVAFSGLSFTNEPIEDRYYFDDAMITGQITRNAEVELYRNNQLIDFKRTGSSGEYRFRLPLTYGTSRYSIRTYGRAGEMIERNIRIRVPFNFVPPGETYYSAELGRLDNPISGSLERGILGRASLSTGLTNRLTATGGVEYFEDFHEQMPTLTGRLSGRLFSNTLISAEMASDAFYRASVNYYHTSSANINAEYTNYSKEGGIYNPSGNRSQFRSTFFTPFRINALHMYTRFSLSNERRDNSSVTRYRFDFNTRLWRTNLRFGYRDSQLGRIKLEPTTSASLTGAISYTTRHSAHRPSVFRGIFMSAQVYYSPKRKEFENAELQISRGFKSKGRIQLSAGRNFISGFSNARLSLIFDFNAFRAHSSASKTGNNYSATQSIRGSIGLDPVNNNTYINNRQQVGRSGIAVRFFLDVNDSGTFDDGDQLIRNTRNLIRVDHALGRIDQKNGVYYISQLEAYRRYNISIQKSGFNNPLLVPEHEQFSVVTDPNQFKSVHIPVYMTGVVDGKVISNKKGKTRGVSGLRLRFIQIDHNDGREPNVIETRTFSDGSFYAHEITAGTYKITADESQLAFMNLTMPANEPVFTIKSKPDGDFVENLKIELIPNTRNILLENAPTIEFINEQSSEYLLQSGTFSSFTQAEAEAVKFSRMTGKAFIPYYNSSTGKFKIQNSSFLCLNSLNNLPSNLSNRSDNPSFYLISESTFSNFSTVTTNSSRLHLGTFQTRGEAEKRVELIAKTTGLNAYTSPITNDLHAVYLNSEANNIDPKTAMEHLKPYAGNLLSMVKEKSISYRFIHGIYSDVYDLLDALEDIQDISSGKPYVVQHEDGKLVLYLLPEDDTPDGLQELKSELETSDSFKLHFIELLFEGSYYHK